jgi:hypothetical protein
MITADGDTVILKTDKAYAPTFLYNCLTAGVASIVDMKTVMANEVAGDMGYEYLAQGQFRRDRGLCAEKLQAERRLCA